MSLADIGAAALRLLDPETAHHGALIALELGLGPNVRADRWPDLRTSVAGLALPNPLGLAAGFDKDARAPRALLKCGFGFVECGTVTPLPQPGNPKPRLFRLEEDRAVINRMGFNNGGLDAFVERLRGANESGIVGANVGANKDSADRVADYVNGLERSWPHASYVTINISSPNTPGLRGLQERGALEELLGRVASARSGVAAKHGPRPLFLKIAPDLDEGAIGEIVEVAVANGVDALIVSNTTVDRPDSLRGAHKAEVGGLSGRPMFEKSTRALRIAAQAANKRIALIGAGGVEDGRTALAKLRAGASAIQLYSALAYEGPSLVVRILDDLAARLKAEGFARLEDAIGAG
jgi:dihydroorotate dehydrogenase